MSDWDQQARELGVSSNTLLGWAPGESKRFVKEYWHLHFIADPDDRGRNRWNSQWTDPAKTDPYEQGMERWRND